MTNEHPGNVYQLDGAVHRQAPPVDRSGGGGDDGGMEGRVAKLEALLPTLATRLDLASEVSRLERELIRVEHSIRADMHREFTAQTWRIIGAILSFGGLLCAGMYFIIRNTAP